MEFKGLNKKDAELRLQKYGLNSLKEEKWNPWIIFLQKFWAPIPWMLEVIILLELVLGKFAVAGVIAILILFNALASFIEEGKAKNALRLLKKKLNVQTRVLREGQWEQIPAQFIVPDDILCIQMGDIVPADAKILSGYVLVDQSAITGESQPVEPAVDDIVYAGSIIKHGEAYAQVTATGENTFFGKAAEIIRTAKAPSHLQTMILSIVKHLAMFDVILILAAVLYSFYHGLSLSELIPFSLLLLVASVPAALPATYTLSTALGSIELAKKGVLVTRLSAIEEASAMNILCVDKTGTITKNILHVVHLQSYSPFTEDDLLRLASFACEEATQDAIDLAILSAAKNSLSVYNEASQQQFIPFDPEKKYTEAQIWYREQNFHVLKGAPTALLTKINAPQNIEKDLETLSADGSRILMVIISKEEKFDLAGLIALQDPPRESSKKMLQEIHDLGIKVIMTTGDGFATARFIAHSVGLGPKIITRDEAEQLLGEQIATTDAISGVFPEDKFHIIQRLQKQGYICGMTGDGVNDAPALKKAEVGIAMSNATDVAKAASSIVLTNPGLDDVIEAIKISRCIYQRMLIYTLNKIIKTLQISVLLAGGLFLANNFIISQLLIVLLLFANDFVTMSISTDKVSFSQKPDQWNIKKLMWIGGAFAFFILILSFFIFFVGSQFLQLPISQMRTWIFLTLVFTGQATIYLVREHKHFWHSRPSSWMIGSSLCTLLIIILMAIQGIWMAPLKPSLIFGLLGGIFLFFLFLDLIKVRIYKLFHYK